MTKIPHKALRFKYSSFEAYNVKLGKNKKTIICEIRNLFFLNLG